MWLQKLEVDSWHVKSQHNAIPVRAIKIILLVGCGFYCFIPLLIYAFALSQCTFEKYFRKGLKPILLEKGKKSKIPQIVFQISSKYKKYCLYLGIFFNFFSEIGFCGKMWSIFLGMITITTTVYYNCFQSNNPKQLLRNKSRCFFVMFFSSLFLSTVIFLFFLTQNLN